MAKKLITESDVRTLARGGELVLEKGTIATPSALDAAFELGIRVVRGTEKPAAAAPAANALARVLEQDGTYIVQVAKGKAVITRLTDQGPQPFGAA